jgi:indole-3-glycerol phosphate synthase
VPRNLDEIIAHTMGQAASLRSRRRQLERQVAAAAPRPPFGATLRRGTVAVIAELKRRSPSAGEIRGDLDPPAHARAYATAGAAAISVLTNGPFFGGSLEDLEQVAGAVDVPLLRKDFILFEEQLLEARAAGASAVLLIVRALSKERLVRLGGEARTLGLETLVEVHDEKELEVALEAGSRVVGVNSRDLDTFEVNVEPAWRLLGRIPSGVHAVAESGLKSAHDVERAALAGADAVLIGTALSASSSPATLLSTLSGVPRRAR